jgi:hypothetical protein
MSKNKMGNFSFYASIDKSLAPEMTVPKLLPTQSPAHKLLSLLENGKDFLDILFGKPSSRKSRDESKSKGSNESIKGENSADHKDEDDEEAPSRPETKILLQVENGYQEKLGFGNGRFQKKEGTLKRNNVQIQEQQVSFGSQEQPSGRVSQCRPQQCSVEFSFG